MKAGGTHRWWAVGALAMALLVGGLDLTVLNLALPTLATSLHASTSGLQWIVDSYSLVVAAALLPSGLVGDRYGRKKFLILALVVFGGASLWCSYANSANELIIARAVLGLGAAMVFPLSLGVLPVLFNEKERPRAVTVLMGTTIVAYPIGPILGGWLLTHYWWGSVFLINVPLAVLAVIAVALLLPESRASDRPSLDVGGVVLSSLALVGMTYGAIAAGEHGWGSLRTLTALAAGLLLLIAFVAWERRVSARGAQPLVEMGLFRSTSFSWGTILATAVSFAMFGLLFTVPQFFQAVQGHDAMATGWRLLPMIFGLVAGGAIADRVTAAAGAKVTVTLGFVVMAAGLIMGTGTHVGSGTWFTAAWIATVGLGLGFALPTAVDAALGQLSKERASVGSGLIQAVRQVGATFGVAVLGSILNSAYRGRLSVAALPAPAADAVRKSVSGGVVVAQKLRSVALLDSVRAAFLHGMEVMLWVCGGLAIVSALLTLGFLPGRRPVVAPGARGAEGPLGREEEVPV